MSKQVAAEQGEHGTLPLYISGFVMSVMLTLAAYFVTLHRTASKDIFIVTIVGLAIAQFLVQLVFFLHLGRETKPRWKLGVFFLMLLVISILVFGSLWIMSNLNGRMMSQQQINTYMDNQDGL